MPKSLPVAVITNADGGFHLPPFFASLADIEEAEAIALVDPSGAHEMAARKALGNKLTRVYKDAADMYKEFRPGVAIVSLEARLCPPAIDAALEAGCHVFSEKPGCVRAEDFAPLAKKAQAKHRHLMLVMANRTHAPVQEAKRILRKGLLGRLYGVEIHIVADQTRLTTEAFRQSWLCSKARAGGGHLAWFGILWLDLAQYITGLKVEAVAGFAGNVGGQPVDVEDAAVLALKFGPRCFGTMTAAYYLDKGIQSHIQIWGEKGWMKLATVEEQPLQWYSTLQDKEPRVQEFAYPKGGRGYTDFLRQGLRAACGNGEPPITAEEGLSLVETVYGFYRAAQTDRTQKV